MIPKECKRLAEVDFPIAEVSRHSAREKSIRHGHPSTLHLWWARRPLAACRAMLLGLLLPDPCDPHCPEEFKEKARETLLNLPGRPAKWDENSKVDKGLREIILKFIAEFYPSDSDSARPIAYLWARTVRCESPNCGAEIPLVRSFWLCKKANRKKALRYKVIRQETLSHLERKATPLIDFEIFEPESEAEVPSGTVTRAKATCLACGSVLPPERVRTQLAAQCGGADVIFDNKGIRTGGARMLAVVTLRPGEQGRNYRLITERDYEAVWKAQQRLKDILDEWERGGRKGLCPVPDEPLPPIGTLGFRVQRYGMLQWGYLFTARQKVALLTISNKISIQNVDVRLMSLALGKLSDLSNVICPWEPIAECPCNVLSNGRIKPSWDFAEGVTISESSGGLKVCIDNLSSGILSIQGIYYRANIELAAAQQSPLPDESARVWFTDPPYYDAIPYADLSDMFFVWFKRCLSGEGFLLDPYDKLNPLAPKKGEAVQDENREFNGKRCDNRYFEEVMYLSFAEGRRVLQEDGIGSVVFAHKTTEGWEALLSGMIRGGWTINGSWPIATEMASRLRARDSAALATSVHLVCRPRPDDAPVGDWAKEGPMC